MDYAVTWRPDTFRMEQSFLNARAYIRQPRFQRWIQRPIKHLTGLTYAYMCYPVLKTPLKARSRLFFDVPVTVALPAGLDIYLTGLKAHDSEVRLTHYLIRAIRPGSTVIDIGAHLGYYSVLMSHLTGAQGLVHALEPTPEIYRVLDTNTRRLNNVKTGRLAIGKNRTRHILHVFALHESEYNSLVNPKAPKQYRKIPVEVETLDAYCRDRNLSPDFVKIDVEGTEADVLTGAARTLSSSRPELAIELRVDAFDELYAPVLSRLVNLGYTAYSIDPEGHLKHADDVEATLRATGLESDNFIFRPR